MRPAMRLWRAAPSWSPRSAKSSASLERADALLPTSRSRSSTSVVRCMPLDLSGRSREIQARRVQVDRRFRSVFRDRVVQRENSIGDQIPGSRRSGDRIARSPGSRGDLSCMTLRDMLRRAPVYPWTVVRLADAETLRRLESDRQAFRVARPARGNLTRSVRTCSGWSGFRGSSSRRRLRWV